MVQGQQLVCSGFGCSNMLACINDGRADPMSPEASKRDRAANVQLLPVAVCRWPFLFMITSEDVTPGGSADCLWQECMWNPRCGCPVHLTWVYTA